MTHTTYPNAAEVCGFTREVAGFAPDINLSFSPNRSNEVQLMNEALARVRMREAVQARTSPGAVRSARLVAMMASRLRNRS